MKIQSGIIAFVVVAALMALTWWQTGEMKEREFAQRIKDAAVHVDSTTTVTEMLQAPQRHEGRAPARMTSVERAEADTAHDRALAVSLDSSRARNAYISAKVDTTIGNDSTGSVRVQYDPPTRMLTIGFHRPPIKTIEKEILKTITVPVIEHDSFLVRAGIFAAGAAAMGIIFAIKQ